MSKRQILIVLGVLVMIFLYMGFPNAWDKFISIILGLLIILISLRSNIVSSVKKTKDLPYVEHRQEDVIDTTVPIITNQDSDRLT